MPSEVSPATAASSLVCSWKHEREQLRSAAEFRAVSWQVTKRTLSTTKAAEPAGIRGIKAREVDPAAAFRERSA